MVIRHSRVECAVRTVSVSLVQGYGAHGAPYSRTTIALSRMTILQKFLRTCSRSLHGAAWPCHALRVAPEKPRLRRCNPCRAHTGLQASAVTQADGMPSEFPALPSPGHQPDCGLRLAATAFRTQRLSRRD